MSSVYGEGESVCVWPRFGATFYLSWVWGFWLGYGARRYGEPHTPRTKFQQVPWLWWRQKPTFHNWLSYGQSLWDLLVMDTSETYIKMCDCEEIQGIRPLDPYRHNVWHDDGWGRTWLPRQDQLQEMVKERLTPYSLLDSFYEWFCRNRAIGNTMEQLWLAFVLKEKYNKVLDGKGWIDG